MKSSLVILYHREPYDEVIENGEVHYRPKKSPNGIVPTLKSFFKNVNQGTWIAWKQVTEEQRVDFQLRVTVEEEDSNYVVQRIPLAEQQVKDFYHITSKEAFWPILHSFPWYFTSETTDWENFQLINQKFAEAACEEAADDALIWVHDYNLWLAPKYIRELKPNARIAFFHHTPFPSVDIFNVLPWRGEIVESLLCCDIVGFHIPRYAENFVNVARSLREIEVVKTGPVPEHITTVGTALAEPEVTTQIRYKGQLVRIDSFPVGTAPEYIKSLVEKPETQELITSLKEKYQGRKLIIAAGRIDYVKGNRQMLEAFERLLERRPELHGKVNFIVSCVAPAKGMQVYDTAKQEIEQLVGKINGRFTKFSSDWIPVLLSTEALSYQSLLGYFAASDICWTTPLRDGLNLVAKEYICTRQNKDGALILSEFVGAAVELPEAILANTYSVQRMDDAIDKALDMPVEEQKERMTKMYETVWKYDVKCWADHLFELFKNTTHDVISEEKKVSV